MRRNCKLVNPDPNDPEYQAAQWRECWTNWMLIVALAIMSIVGCLIGMGIGKLLSLVTKGST